MNKKNILVILCDQLRFDFLSCYGFKSIKTPNIDSLAKDGVLFHHAVTASPVCAPGRACMMTGRYVSDHGVWTNDVPFRDGIEFLPQRMTDNNYETFCIGKLHHYPAKDTKGFKYSMQMEERRLKENDDYFKWLKSRHPEIKDLFNVDEDGYFKYDESEYYEHWICDNAIEQIEKSATKPFFGWVSFQGPHGPLDPPKTDFTQKKLDITPPKQPEFIPPCEVVKYRRSANDGFSIEDQLEYRQKYCHLIEEIDAQVGRIISYLKKFNLYDDTVIIFSADHGDLCGDYNMRQKGPFIYSAQLEIPFIIANHPELPKGIESDMLTGNLDIGTTVLQIAGDNKPLGYSRSVSEMFKNKDLQRNYIYSEFADSIRIVSNKTYRMAYFPFTGECELVKIDKETENLADLPEYSQLKCEMLKQIIDFMVIAKGIHIEAQDLTPKVQKGIEQKMPGFKDIIPLCFPLGSMQCINNLKNDGLDSTYLDFCKTKNILRYYGKYWESKNN